MEIIIGCPANRFTGGPTLAHQLCSELNKQGFSAKMYYYNVKDSNKIQHPKYRHFGNKFTTKLVDDYNTIFIAPETNPDMLKKIRKGKKVIWWMSVDNYFDKYLKSKRNLILNICGLLKFDIFHKDVLHFAQSHYAIEFLKKNLIDSERIFYISDYLDEIFIAQAELHLKKDKSNRILFSPKRGFDFTSRLIKETPNLEWVPLVNLSQEEMIDLMQTSKLYIDFGNHPGKDRIPREAAINGCCIMTGNDGSAGNKIDINIPDELKFNKLDTNIPSIISKIYDIIDNYEYYYKLHEEYRKKIVREHDQFVEEVHKIFSNL